MAFTLSMDTDNAAFGEMPELEVSRILRSIAERVEYEIRGPIVDVNGNTVGYYELKNEEV